MPNSKRKSHCNKRPYPSLLTAQIGLKRTLTAKKKKGDPIVTLLSAYKCEHCPAFHVGRDRTRGINWSVIETHDRKVKERCAKTRQENSGVVQSGNGPTPAPGELRDNPARSTSGMCVS